MAKNQLKEKKEKLETIRTGTLNLDVPKFVNSFDKLAGALLVAEEKLNESVNCTIDVDSYDDMHHLFIETCNMKPLKLGKSGRISFAKDIIENWDTPFTQPVIDIKTIRGKLKYFNTVRKLIDLSGIHSNVQSIPFELVESKTGRVYARNTAVMSFPGEIRECIIPDDGYVFIGADVIAQELCILAYLTECNTLISDVRRGVDPFQVLSDETGIDREKVKLAIYSFMYGSVLDRIASKIFLPQDKVIQIFTVLFGTYPELQRWIAMVEDFKKIGCSSTFKGRMFTIDKSNPDRDKEVRRCANGKVQGSAAEFLRETIDIIDKDTIQKYVISVHDSVVAQVPKAQEAEGVKALKEFMESQLQGSFRVKIRTGDNWKAVWKDS